MTNIMRVMPGLLAEPVNAVANPDHRYWKIVFDYGNSGNAGWTTLSELGMFPTSAGGTNLITLATLSTPIVLQAGSLAALYDGDYTTYAQWGQGNGMEIDLDFGSGNAYDIGYVTMGPLTSFETRAPTATHVEWSDDGVTYTRQWFQNWFTWSTGVSQVTTRPSGTNGLYWRVVRVDGGNALSASEITMAASTGGSNLATTSSNAWASSSFSGTGPQDAFDGNTSTLWSSDGATNAAYTNWIAYAFPTVETITEITWRDRGDGPPSSQNPASGSVQFSDYPSSLPAGGPQGWLEAWSWTGASWTSTGEILTFDS